MAYFKVKKGDQVIVTTGRDRGKKVKSLKFCALTIASAFKASMLSSVIVVQRKQMRAVSKRLKHQLQFLMSHLSTLIQVLLHAFLSLKKTVKKCVSQKHLARSLVN